MSNDRFKFRRPVFREDKFVGFDILEITDSLYPTARTELAHLCGGHMPGDTIGDWEQCSGLSDKNGNLIYEGDVVEIGNGSINGSVWKDNRTVEWIGNKGRYNLPAWTSDAPDWSHYVKIIGNIHETEGGNNE